MTGIRVEVSRFRGSNSQGKTKRVFCVVVISIFVPLLFWIEKDNSGYNNHNIQSGGVGMRIQKLLNNVEWAVLLGFARRKRITI
jgi:hypothetical protein